MDNTNDSNIQNGKAEDRQPEHITGVRGAALHILNNKKESFMWVSRLATMMFTILYVVPFLSESPFSYYHKALMANAFTSILRLNQRLPRVEFSRSYLGLLLMEDSCHYVLYTLIFLYTYPMTVVLMPIFLFAALHSANFNIKLLQICGWDESRFGTTLTGIVQDYSKSLFSLIAYTEIFLMPLNIFMIFVGKGSLLTPVVYYRFLTLRYQSKRNPYTRSVFYELRLFVEVLASQSVVPQRIKQLCHKLIELVSRLAPPVVSD